MGETGAAPASRDAGIDAVRTLAILAIVAGHIWASETITLALYSWHVPVFFFLSGYLASARKPVRDFVRDRAQTLLRPYLAWFTVIYIAFLIVTLLGPAPSLMTLVAPLYGGYYALRPFTTFWFVFVLFAAVVLFRLAMRAPLWALGVLAAVAVAFATFLGPQLATTPLAVGSAIPALAFVIAGFAARRVEPRIPSGAATRIPLGAALLLIAGAALASGLVDPVNIKQGDWGTPVAGILVACLISWGLVLIARAVAWGRLGAVFTSFALIGFAVVLAHPAVLWMITPVIDGMPRPVVFLLALGLPAAAGYALQRTPLAGWATGSPQRGVRQTPASPLPDDAAAGSAPLPANRPRTRQLPPKPQPESREPEPRTPTPR